MLSKIREAKEMQWVIIFLKSVVCFLFSIITVVVFLAFIFGFYFTVLLMIEDFKNWEKRRKLRGFL